MVDVVLKARERRWLSNEVQADLFLLCKDGKVAAHSALLADISEFISSLLACKYIKIVQKVSR